MKNTIKNLILFGLFVVPFIVFLVPSAYFFPFISGKGFLFRILVGVLTGLFAYLAIIEPKYRPKLSWITKSVLAFAVVMLVADLLGANPYKSIWSNYERMEGFVLIFHLVLYYIVASSVIDTKKIWNWFINTTIIASAMMSVYGVFQLLGLATINQGGVRVDGTLGNAAYFAIYLVFHIFLSLYMFLDSTNPKWQRWSYIGVAVLETIILYFTATRGAILGLIGGLFITGVLIAWRERENVYIRKIAYSVLGSIALVIVLFVALRQTSVVQSSPVLSRFSTLSFSEFKTQGRYFVWPMAVKGFMDRPILGWGQEGFNFVFNKYYDPRMYGQEQWFDRTHNVVLDWLIAGGILGLVSYISIFISLFYYIWRKRSKLNLSEKSVLTGMIVAYVFHNLFVFDNLISYILFFTVLAYIHATNYTDQKNEEFSKNRVENKIGSHVAAPVILILSIGFIYFVNIPALRANTTLIEAISSPDGADKNLALFRKVYDYNSFGSTEATEQLVDFTIRRVMPSQLPQTLKDEFYEFARQKVEEKVAQTPTDARYLVFAGSFFNNSSRYDEAIKYLERAVEQSPNKQTIYFELGTSYLAKGNTAKMFEIFKKAYDLQPNAPESKIIYALGAIYTKNASVLAQISKEINPDLFITDSRFLQAYEIIGDYQNVINIRAERLKRDPTNGENKLMLAQVYVTVGQKQKAIGLIRELIADYPEFKSQGEEYIQKIESQ